MPNMTISLFCQVWILLWQETQKQKLCSAHHSLSCRHHLVTGHLVSPFVSWDSGTDSCNVLQLLYYAVKERKREREIIDKYNTDVYTHKLYSLLTHTHLAAQIPVASVGHLFSHCCQLRGISPTHSDERCLAVWFVTHIDTHTAKQGGLTITYAPSTSEREYNISIFAPLDQSTHVLQTAYTAINIWANWQILVFQKQYTVLLLILCLWASNNTLLNCSLEDQYSHMVLTGIATVYSTKRKKTCESY